MLGLDNVTNSYLSGRSQCVKLNNLISTTLPITYGVPQRSILGPIRFSLYIDNIATIVNCGIVLYADDTVIYFQKILTITVLRLDYGGLGLIKTRP